MKQLKIWKKWKENQLKVRWHFNKKKTFTKAKSKN